jgi:hypothetical protein
MCAAAAAAAHRDQALLPSSLCQLHSQPLCIAALRRISLKQQQQQQQQQ